MKVALVWLTIVTGYHTLSLYRAPVCLCLTAGLVSYFSELLVTAIEGAAHAFGCPQARELAKRAWFSHNTNGRRCSSP